MEGEITFEKWILAEYETLKEAYNQLPHGVKDPDVFVKDKKDKKDLKLSIKDTIRPMIKFGVNT